MIEHSVICDQCSAIIAAGFTVNVARSEAYYAGAVREGRPKRDICKDCLADRARVERLGAWNINHKHSDPQQTA